MSAESLTGPSTVDLDLSRPPTHLFRALWPITNPRLPLARLIEEAREDLPRVERQAAAYAHPGAGRWRVARSSDIPGSGRVTETVLIFEAPAWPLRARAYHRRSAA